MARAAGEGGRGKRGGLSPLRHPELLLSEQILALFELLKIERGNLEKDFLKLHLEPNLVNR